MSHLDQVENTDTFKTWRVSHNNIIDLINLGTIGTVTVDSVREMLNWVESAGIFNGCSVTDAGGGNVDVAGGEAFLRIGANVGDEIVVAQIPPLAAITPTDQDITYIWADYNAGVPSIGSSTNANDFNGHDKCLIALVSREGTDVTILEAQEKPVDNSNRINQMMIDTHGIHHVQGGSRISETGTRNFAVSAGAFYRGLKKVTHPDHDTAGADNFEYYYKDGIGGWVEVGSQTQIDNVNYDDGSGTLAALTAGNYSVHWVYMKIGTNKHELYVLYGSGDHATVEDARAEEVPASIPPTLEEVGVLLGKIIILKNDNLYASVETAFGASFIAGAPSNHENLTGLQGGAVGDHYHLTGAEHTTISGHPGDTANPHSVTAVQVGADPEGEALAMSIALG